MRTLGDININILKTVLNSKLFLVFGHRTSIDLQNTNSPAGFCLQLGVLIGRIYSNSTVSFGCTSHASLSGSPANIFAREKGLVHTYKKSN